MKNGTVFRKSAKKLLIKTVFILTIVFAAFIIVTLSASAVSDAQAKAAEITDSGITVIGDKTIKSYCRTATEFNKAFKINNDRAKALALTDEEIADISKNLAKQARIQKKKLDDGKVTYFVDIDMTADDAKFYANPLVVRKTSGEIIKRIDKLAKKQKAELWLMDYTHVVGELTIHYRGYRITKALGGEKSDLLIGSLYDSFSDARINADEYRFPVVIRTVGVIFG